MPALETDQPVQFIRDFCQSHIDVAHALFMQTHALFLLANPLLVLSQVPGLHLLHFGLLPLYIGHDRHRVLEPGYRLFEVHLNLV